MTRFLKQTTITKMVVWSAFSRNFGQKALSGLIIANRNTVPNISKNVLVNQVRHGGHGPKNFIIRPSDWQWDKFKDLIHFYVMVGAIPITLICLYTNLYIGPAKLAPIPEGYEPKHWEYHKHPITRFLARYIVKNPQQEYEKMCHELYEEGERIRLRGVEKDIRRKMAERQDYQAWYYRPAMVKYARGSKKFFEDYKETHGN